jgi:hypothetical protein
MMVPTLFGDEVCAPVAEDTILWRYLDLSWFLALLVDRALYFSSATEFADPWEGAIPPPVEEAFASRFGAGWGLLAEHFREVASMVRVQCWFASPYESVAMWRNFARDGVAIKTTVRSLRTSLDLSSEHLRIARIQYVDHGTYDIGDSGYSALASLLLKRRGYEHEQEIRAMVLPMDESSSGISLGVEPATLIEGIVVSPEYPDWAVPAFREIIYRMGLKIEVETSSLKSAPPARLIES